MRCRGHHINEKFLCENWNRFWALFSCSSCNLFFFPVSGSFFCRFARAPHHENSLNLRWDWRTVLCRGQFMHFQSTSMNEKKNPSRCFQQIGFCLFLAFIWIFQLLNRLNSKSSNCFTCFKNQCKSADSAHF